MAVTFVLVLMMAAVGSSSLQTLSATSHREKAIQLRSTALSGIQKSLLELTNDEAQSGTFTATLPNFPDFSYQVTLVNNRDGSLGNPHVTPDSYKVPAGHVYVSATGSQGNDEVTYTALAFRPPIKMVAAAFGDESVTVNGGKVRLWESHYSRPREFTPPNTPQMAAAMADMAGSGPQPTMKITAKSNKSALATNSKDPDALMAHGDATISGNVTYGRGAAVNGRGGVVSVIGSAPTQQNSGTPWDAASSSSPTGPSSMFAAGAVTQSTASSPSAGTNQVDSTVTFFGNVEVNAQDVPFPVYEPPMSNPASAWEERTYQDMTPPPPPPGTPVVVSSGYTPPPSEILMPGNYKNITLEPGAAITLVAGSYYISDWLTLDGGTILVDDSAGPVELVVGKGITASNSDINRYGDAQKFQVYCLGEASQQGGEWVYGKSELNLSDDTYMCAAVVGEELETDIQGGGFYGAIMGKSVVTTDSSVYHDTRLEQAALEREGPWVQKNVVLKGREGSKGDWGAFDPFQQVYEEFENGGSGVPTLSF